jgi:hexulose-6-phosphate isomerase
MGGFVDLLSGDVDFPRVLAALKSIGYDGAIIAEISAAAHYPREGARRTSHAMDAILGR